MVEKVFTQANLADCLQIKLSDHSLNDSERTKVDEDLQKALETFNDTCLKVFASDRSNEYYASLLCKSLRKYVDFSIHIRSSESQKTKRLTHFT
jgi:hypothetical protein